MCSGKHLELHSGSFMPVFNDQKLCNIKNTGSDKVAISRNNNAGCKAYKCSPVAGMGT